MIKSRKAMRWGRESTNIEDRRGFGGRGIAVGGGGIGVLILALVVWLCGGDPQALLDRMGGSDPTRVEQPQTQQPNAQSEDDQKRFISSVLGSTEDVWRKILPQQARKQYRDPKLVLFTGQVRSACGNADSSVGPFYCGGDERLYLDFAFFNELKKEFKAPGDFAQAYVVAHEVGHHVQKIMGMMQKVNDAGNSNELSVKLELQADCYAGVWAFYADKQGLVEAGDAEEAIRAAQSVGDDTIQKRSQGYVIPEKFTHGSSRDRMSWFTRGFLSGDIRQCDTFKSG